MRFNTAISALMILATEMEKLDKINKEDFKKFLGVEKELMISFTGHPSFQSSSFG